MTAPPVIPTRYTSQQVRHLAGITYRQLDYWVRIGILEADWRLHDLRTITDLQGIGYNRVFSPAELVKAQAMAQMLADGISFQQAKRAVIAGHRVVWALVPLPAEPDLGDSELEPAEVTP